MRIYDANGLRKITASTVVTELGVEATVLAAGATNNLAVSDNITHVHLTPNAGGSNVTGLTIASLHIGQKVVITNTSATLNLTLTHNSGSSTRPFLCPGAGDLILPPLTSTTAWYDSAAGAYRIGA